MEYPYNSAFIINDTVFVAYGGQTGTSTPAQRAAAYLIAERQMTQHIGAFLKPTIVTGTYLCATSNPVQLTYGYVRSIISVVIHSAEDAGDEYVYTASDIATYVFVRNWECGYLDIILTPVGWICCNPITPYTVEIAWESGLLTGTSVQPDMLLALTCASQIILNEVVGDGTLMNEGIGDIGIQEFSNQFYHEIRAKLGHSEFGGSAKANFISKLIKHLRPKNSLRFH